MLCHVVYLRPVQVDSVGNVLTKDTSTIKGMLNTSTEVRIFPNPAVPASAGYPTIEAFLVAEALIGFKAAYVGNTMIVLYNG